MIRRSPIDSDVLNAGSQRTMTETLGVGFTDFIRDVLSANMPWIIVLVQLFGILYGGGSENHCSYA